MHTEGTVVTRSDPLQVTQSLLSALHHACCWFLPGQFSAVNTSGHCVAVAGKTGLAHYTLFSRKWKLFGNETQVSDRGVRHRIHFYSDH